MFTILRSPAPLSSSPSAAWIEFHFAYTVAIGHSNRTVGIAPSSEVMWTFRAPNQELEFYMRYRMLVVQGMGVDG